MNVSSIGYVYGFQGTGFKANNPKFELLATFPNLAPFYGVVASLLFGLAYSTSNMVVAGKTKKVNPLISKARTRAFKWVNTLFPFS